MYPQEFTGHREELRPLFENELEFVDGSLLVPTGPGLGLEVNETRMRTEATSVI